MSNDCIELNAFDLGVGPEQNGTITLVMVGHDSATYLNVTLDRAIQLSELIRDVTHTAIRQRREQFKNARGPSAISIISEAVNNYPLGAKFTAGDIAKCAGLNPGATANILNSHIRIARLCGTVTRNRRPVNLYERVE